ncbi:hypothetical protein MVEN_01096100 [Mycena venus]|uniref:Uncharacterized protein n=1 Tax=Mycena venus TaxID=2733690 RepID=A0A8H7CZP3_9AGAR|nr:hypothetical protein MVEN_01096100 [Mycena venus]
MTRFSTTFLVSVLAASFFTASAAPLQLHSRFGARAEGEAAAAESGGDAQSAADNSNIVVTLLTAGIAVLDQTKVADQELTTELDTVKALMQAAAIESAGLANANATAIAEGGDNGGQDDGNNGLANANATATAEGGNNGSQDDGNNGLANANATATAEGGDNGSQDDGNNGGQDDGINGLANANATATAEGGNNGSQDDGNNGGQDDGNNGGQDGGNNGGQDDDNNDSQDDGNNGGQDDGNNGDDNSAAANGQDPKATVASVISSAQAAQKTQGSDAAGKNSRRQFGRSRR